MNQPNWENRTLFHGDNLKFMQAMNSESVDLIATDPPFNKGRDFHATPDSLASGAKFQDRWSWEHDVHEDWLDQINDDHPHVMNVIQGSRSSYGDDMGAFLCFMAVRLLAMRRVLKASGSIYLHCDPSAGHYLKELMDAVFGRKHFRNQIVWYYTNSGGRGKRTFAKKHDMILWYTKTNQYFFDGFRDGQERHAGKTSRGGVIYEKDGKMYQQIWSNGKSYTYCLSDDRIADDVWDFQPIPPHGTERVGYPTQKPLRLYERIVSTTSNENDVVFDPFAGCATTLVAAEKLKRQWVGIDLWDKSAEVVTNRLQREALLGMVGKSAGVLPIHGYLTFTDTPPERTDDGEVAAPYLRPKVKIKEPEGPKWTRKQMYEYLLDQHGMVCQGCDRVFDDSRYLELDHNTPRADGGLNHISNRVLLCGPCNRLKSNTYTLGGLRKENNKRGYMAG